MDYAEAVNEFEEFFSTEMYTEVATAVQQGKETVVVDVQERLDPFAFELYEYLRDNPASAIDAAEEGLMGNDQITDEDIKVRFTNMPEEDFVLLKDLRSDHIGKFIPVEGMIKRASQVKPEVVSAIFECVQCGDQYEKVQEDTKLKSPYKCDCGSRKFDVMEKKMTDTQVVTMEENPENREGSEQPTSLSVRLEGDLVDPEFQEKVVPGNVAHVTGVLREKPLKKNSKKYDIYMDANYLEPTQQEFEKLELSKEEEEEIRELGEDPEIFDKIARSIAPSIYGHHQIKKAIALQLFGGVKKTRDDGVKSRGDLHILLIGEPGTGKCVSPDTEIMTAEGEKYEIGNLIDEAVEESENVQEVDDGVYVEKEIETLGMDENLKIERKKSSKFWKREAPEKMLKIKTCSGREIEVTPSHPLFIQKHGEIAPVKAEELEEDCFIAAPRKLEIKGNDTLEISYRESKANNAVRIDPPKKLNPGLSRLLGYLAAEGHIQKTDEHSDTVYITNNDEEIIEDIEKQLEELGANYTRRLSHEEKNAKEIHSSSSELVSFLKAVEPSLLKPSRERRIPEQILSASNKNIKAFIKAFGDAEGTVSDKEREICIGSTSRQILEEIQLSLQRFSIQSQLKPRKDSYRLRISGHDFEKYAKKIGFITERKSDASTSFSAEHNTNTDVVPNIGRKLRGVREDLEMTQFDFSVDRGCYQHYERLHRNPSREKLKVITEDFKNRIEKLEEMESALEEPDWKKLKQIRKKLGESQKKIADHTSGTQTLIGQYERGERKGKNPELLRETAKALQKEISEIQTDEKEIKQIEKLANSEIFWDKIETIEEIEPEYEHVYDLEIPEQHNYITNNLVSHNSQLLKFSGELAPKGRYVVGKSSTGAGLTASVVKEESTGEFSLEAGAVVLANKGMAAIDEIDKMAAEDRSSLHEAMEQQQISVSKANIQATLNAETSILAAGNPKMGRFDPYEPIPQQINIGDTLLSRFDFIFPVKDEPDKDKDEKLSEQVLMNHIEPEDTKGEISQEMLRKYVAYAQKNVRPQLTQEAADIIQDFYVGMRSQGSDEAGESVPITARQLEALVRVAEASARAELNEEVREKDAQRAIDILKHCLEQVGVDPETGDFDIDMIESGVSSSQRNRVQTLKKIVADLGGEDEAVETQEVINQAEEQGIKEEKAEEIINKLKSEGELFEPQQGSIQRI